MPAERQFLPAGSMRARGWMAEQLRREADGFVGRLDELCTEVGSDAFGNRVAIGDSGTSWWNGESEGNWADALMRLAAAVDHDGVERKASAYVEHLLATQADDGYLGIYTDAVRSERPGRLSGDLWAQSRVLSALLVRHGATGDPAPLEEAVRAARLTVETSDKVGWDALWDDDRNEDGGRAHGLMIVEPLLELFDITGDKVFLDGAQRCYEAFSAATVHWGVNDCQLNRLVDPLVPFHSHGVHTCEHLRLPLLLHEATGDARFAAAAAGGYSKMSDNIGVTGACKSDEFIGAKDAGGVPLPAGGYEACTITELLFSLHARARALADMAAADEAEHLLFNAGEGQSRPDGRTMAYLSAANLYDATDRRGWQWAFSATHRVVCCAPNLGRLLPGHVSRMVTRDAGGGLTVLFYGPSEARATLGDVTVALTQDTSYPFEDDVRLRIRTSRPHRFSLMLRVPGWARTATVAAPDGSVVTHGVGTLTIDRVWDDDELLLSFTADIRLIEAADGTVAVARGPLVFALAIPHDEAVAREGALPGFDDLHFRPTADAEWDVTLQVDHGNPGRMFELVRRPVGDSFPWEQPPLELRTMALDPTYTTTTVAASAREIRLLPFGATTLRRTTFPSVDRTGRPVLPPAEP